MGEDLLDSLDSQLNYLERCLLIYRVVSSDKELAGILTRALVDECSSSKTNLDLGYKTVMAAQLEFTPAIAFV